MEKPVFSDLVGYEEQKARLRENTESFIARRGSNNVLLYGDAGTGKSTSIQALLSEYAKDGLRIIGRQKLTGGTADAAGDHRIAMSAAVAAAASEHAVTILGAECVKKSYPCFWADLEALEVTT